MDTMTTGVNKGTSGSRRGSDFLIFSFMFETINQQTTRSLCGTLHKTSKEGLQSLIMSYDPKKRTESFS